MARTRGWVPDQHGAWVMVFLPFVLGVIIARPHLIHLPLFIAWLVGYFCFFAASLWLKARPNRKPHYLPPLITYGMVSALACLLTLWLNPHLLWFGLLFTTLVAVAAWEAIKRRPRSLASGIATVLASALMLPVTVAAAGADPWSVWARTLLVALYFCGTIPYVKTLIRNRNDPAWLQGSVGYHAVAFFLVSKLAWNQLVSWWALPVFLAYALRAWWVPTMGRKWRPKEIGIGEMVSSAALAAVVLAS